MSKQVYTIAALEFRSMIFSKESISKSRLEKYLKDLKRSKATRIEVSKNSGGKQKFIQYSRLTSESKWVKVKM